MKILKVKLKHLLTISFTLLLAACSSTPQPTVALNTNLFANEDLTIGIAYADPEEEATTHIYGAGCLLCYGVASALTSSLDSHLEKSIDNTELEQMKQLVLSQYAQRAKNIEVVSLPTPIKKLKKFKGELGFAKKDFTYLKKKLGIDVLVVFEVNRHGAYRSFSNYIPNGDPQGYVAGLLYSIDLQTNAYVQYLEIDEKVQPVGEWDEGPSFPSVTTSYYQAVENVKEKIKAAI